MFQKKAVFLHEILLTINLLKTMHPTRRLLLILSVLLSAELFYAAPRTPEEALSVARRTAALRAPSRQGSSPVTCEIISRSDAWYAINAGSSFVIVSSDDTMPEVLGFSPHGALTTATMPPALKAWLEDYNTHPLYLTSAEDECAPLVPCQWNQGTPFNNMVPTYNGTNHCVTGCTATAMAQLMYTHRYPSQGTGSHSYDWTCAENPAYSQTLSADFGNTTYRWDLMLDSYRYYSQYTPEQAQAVAQLMYHCGVAIEMDYGADGSSGSYAAVTKGLMTYFGYDHNILILKKTMYEMDYIAEQIRKELRAGRPVFVSGQGAGGGHAFLCDGFNSDGYFHINWGWGGLADGDYLLTGLNPTDQGIGGNNLGDYNSDVSFTIGIQPATGSTDTTYQMSVAQIELPEMQAARSETLNIKLMTIKNEGVHDFHGQYSVGLLSKDADEIQAVLSNPKTTSLPANYFFTTPISFYCSFPPSIPNGTYRLCGLFRPESKEEWQIIQESGGKHLTSVTLTSTQVLFEVPEQDSPVELATDSIKSSQMVIARDGKWDMTAYRVMNVGEETFTGQLGVVLLDPFTGEVASVLGVRSTSTNLPMNYFFTNPITITKVSVPPTVPSGSYLLSFAHRQVYCKWKPIQLAAKSNGQAVMPVIVTDSQILISEIGTGIEDVEGDSDFWLDPKTKVYTVSGLAVKATDILPSGVYILVRDGRSRKIFIP